MLVWSPESEHPGVGRIYLDRRISPLQPRQYQALLGDRINVLVARENPDSARALLDEMWKMERLLPDRKLRLVGDFMVENSQWLRERAPLQWEPVILPVKLEQGSPEDESLEEFLSQLYRV